MGCIFSVRPLVKKLALEARALRKFSKKIGFSVLIWKPLESEGSNFVRLGVFGYAKTKMGCIFPVGLLVQKLGSLGQFS